MTTHMTTECTTAVYMTTRMIDDSKYDGGVHDDSHDDSMYNGGVQNDNVNNDGVHFDDVQ